MSDDIRALIESKLKRIINEQAKIKEEFLRAFIADTVPRDKIARLKMSDLKLIERDLGMRREYTIALRDDLDDRICAKAFDDEQPRPALSDATEFKTDDFAIRLSMVGPSSVYYKKWRVDIFSNYVPPLEKTHYDTAQEAWAAAEKATKGKP